MNVPPNPKLQGFDAQKKLARQAAAWLRDNDPNARRDRKLQKLEQRRDIVRAKKNPSLIAARKRALHLT